MRVRAPYCVLVACYNRSNRSVTYPYDYKRFPAPRISGARVGKVLPTIPNRTRKIHNSTVKIPQIATCSPCRTLVLGFAQCVQRADSWYICRGVQNARLRFGIGAYADAGYPTNRELPLQFRVGNENPAGRRHAKIGCIGIDPMITLRRLALAASSLILIAAPQMLAAQSDASPTNGQTKFIFLLKDGFRGWVCVDFDIAGAEPLPRKGAARVIRQAPRASATDFR